MLSGSIEAECGSDTLTAGTGGVIFLPRGLSHTFRSVGGPAEILFIVTPGKLDEFFRRRDAGDADPAEIAQLAREYGF